MPSVDESLEINVNCPQCKKEKVISVPKYLFSNKKMGTLKVQVHQGICCEHAFIAFISKNGAIRGYESIDMAIDLSKIEESSVQGKIFFRDILKKYGDYALSSCFHAILLNVPIIILRKKTEKGKTAEISKLFNDSVPPEFNQNLIQVSTIWDVDYRKAEISEGLVISPEGLIAHAPWTEIPLKTEKRILGHAMEILDDNSQTLIVQEQIEEVLIHAQYITELILETEYFEEELAKQFKAKFNKTPNEDYLKLLKQIVQFRFKGDISRIKIRSFSKLKESLW